MKSWLDKFLDAEWIPVSVFLADPEIQKSVHRDHSLVYSVKREAFASKAALLKKYPTGVIPIGSH